MIKPNSIPFRMKSPLKKKSPMKWIPPTYMMRDPRFTLKSKSLQTMLDMSGGGTSSMESIITGSNDRASSLQHFTGMIGGGV